MEAEFWDGRYGRTEYVYGQAPNVFIAAASQRYLPKPLSLVVELASGEGRNVVFLAQKGHHVHAVDFSQVGLDKTLQLAMKAGVAGHVSLHCADVTTWQPPQGSETAQAVIMSFCHIAPDAKRSFFANLVTMLAPGGYLLLETFRPDQRLQGYKSGGPHDPGMMFSLHELRQLLRPYPGQELEGEELDYMLHEGAYHEGMGAVVRFVWQKAQ